MSHHKTPVQSFLNSLDRRRLLFLGAGAAGSIAVPRFGFGQDAAVAAAAEPHFFLQIVFTGGMDPTYTFDARPLEFVAKKVHANYHTDERIVRQGTNGGSCLTTTSVKALDPFRDRFSVVNGVMMLSQFDGHDNNTGFMLTGDGFGGDAQLPQLNTVGEPTPLDYVQLGGGFLNTTFTNAANSVPLDPTAARSFATKMAALPSFSGDSELRTRLRDRMDMASRGRGRFSAGARAMSAAFGKMPVLAEALRTMDVGPQGKPAKPGISQEDDIPSSIKLIGELFKRNVCRSALFISGESGLDTHGVDDAKKMPAAASKLMGQVATMLAHLAGTPFDDTRSLLDVTTFVVSTEFSRTLRQTYPQFEKSGTDHNPLSNSVLIGGKGIRGGQVIGASDFQKVGETLSAAHLAHDAEKVKMMARPFDFTNFVPAAAAPSEFREEDYLTYSSVANTVGALFGINDSLYRLTRRNGPKAPVISPLLA